MGSYDDKLEQFNRLKAISANWSALSLETKKELLKTFKVYKSCMKEIPLETILVCINEVAESINQELINSGINLSEDVKPRNRH